MPTTLLLTSQNFSTSSIPVLDSGWRILWLPHELVWIKMFDVLRTLFNGCLKPKFVGQPVGKMRSFQLNTCIFMFFMKKIFLIKTNYWTYIFFSWSIHVNYYLLVHTLFPWVISPLPPLNKFPLIIVSFFKENLST